MPSAPHAAAAGSPVPPTASTALPSMAHLAAYIGSVIFVIIVISATYFAFTNVRPNVTTFNATSTVTSVSQLNKSMPPINVTRSQVLYGMNDTAGYILVQNNTLHNYIQNGTDSPYWLISANYALNFTLPIVAPTYAIPVNVPIDVPASFKNYSAPLSSDAAVYLFSNDTAAAKYFYSALGEYSVVPRAFVLNNVHVETIFSQDNASSAPYFMYAIGPIYGNTISVTKFVLYDDYVVEVTGLGVYQKYDVSYTDNVAFNIANQLASKAIDGS